MFDFSREPVYIHDLEGRFIDANNAALQLLGYEKADMPSMVLSDLLDKGQASEALESARHMAATGLPNVVSEFKIRRKDGGTLDLEVAASIIYHRGKPSAVIGVARNITRRKKTVEALQLNEYFYRLLADNVTDSVWLMDMNLKTLYVSPSSEKLRGYTTQEMLDLPAAKHLTPSSIEKGLKVFTQELAKLEKDPDYATGATLELEFYRKDGSTFWSENTFSLVKDDAGKPFGILGVGRDITERKKAEDELKKINERLQKAMIGAVETISMISELRDPYTAGHQNQVARLAAAIAEEMHLPEKKVGALKMAGTLHNIGKVSIPSEILSKPGHLNNIEFDMIRQHPIVGREILKSIDFPFPICRFVAEHHERMDGSGYPAGLKGEEISIEARILAVADVISAMGSHRPYRAALGMDKALEEITQNRGILYDPAVVDACIILFTQKGFNLE